MFRSANEFGVLFLNAMAWFDSQQQNSQKLADKSPKTKHIKWATFSGGGEGRFRGCTHGSAQSGVSSFGEITEKDRVAVNFRGSPKT